MRKFILCMVFMYAAVVYAADGIVGIVNGDVITESELSEFLRVLKFKISMSVSDPVLARSQFETERLDALNKLIEDRLIIQAAQSKGYVIPQELIDEKAEEFRSQFRTEEDFENALIERGINIKILKKKVSDQILMRQIINDEVRSTIKINPYEITEYYNANKEEMKLDASLKYRAVIAENSSKADSVHKQLIQPSADFDNIFRAYSDIATYGTLNESDVMDELKVLFAESDKKIFKPIVVSGNYYVFVIDERLPVRYPDLKDVYGRISELLFEKKFVERFAQWVDKLKKDAVIKLNQDG